MKKPVLVLGYFLFALLLSSCRQDQDDTLFTLLPKNATHIDFRNIIRESKDFNVMQYGYLYNGGGVAIGDINNDMLPDIFFSGNIVSSKLYLNKGNFKFEDITIQAGVAAEDAWNTGVTMADVNGDGFLDIYLCRSADTRPSARQNLLFINNGDLTFTEQTKIWGLADPGYSTQASFFDYDRDGDLDMYLLNHSIQEYAGFSQITSTLKKRQSPFYGDKLYRNDGTIFVDVSREAGIISNVLGFGLGVSVSDINADGWPDIYVSNDYNEQDYLYINNGDGSFSERLEDYLGHVSLFSMGSDIADINNDGYGDIITLDMLPESNYRQKLVSGPDNYEKYQLLVNSGFYNQSMRNMLQLNNGGSSFSEIGQLAGVSNTDWSWAPLFADFDNDGFKDLFVTNGYQRDYTNMDFMNYMVNEQIRQQRGEPEAAIMEIIEQMPSILSPNYIFQNNKNLSFTKKTKEWGFNQESLSNGAAYADLDNDGDLDLVVSNINDYAFIYRNNTEKLEGRHYLKISLVGQGKNTKGIGAKVTLYFGSGSVFQEMIPTRGFQSSVDYNLIFGLGNTTKIDSLKVLWPDGNIQLLENIDADQQLVLSQKDAFPAPNTSTSAAAALFIRADQETGINYLHRENVFTDFKREQLLPHKLSTQGPKLAVGDVNQDGLEDFFIGGAKGSAGKLFVQNKSGKFQESGAFHQDSLSEDVGATFFDADKDGDLDLYVVSGGSDFSSDSQYLQDRLYFNNGKGRFQKKAESLPVMLSSGSCVSAGDLDNDGHLDLFVGGRLIPGEYPLSPRSYILKNDGKGNFKDVTAEVNESLTFPGLVCDALWSDFNMDGKVDLIITGEWMPIRIFENTNGKLKEITDSCGTKQSEGWWNKIIADDFDKDGDPDYVIGNFGWNSQIKASITEPACLYVKDFDNNGTIDPILCYFVQGESYPAFSKDDLEGQIPSIKKKYANYAEFADKKITDLFSNEELKDTIVLKAKTFASSYLENLGNNQFRLTELPIEAQLSPIYGIISIDIDNDGHKDLLMGGNFSGTRVKFGKYDANKGLLLKGDGSGKFELKNKPSNGLAIDGEVRDITYLKKGSGERLILIARNNDPLLVYKTKHN